LCSTCCCLCAYSGGYFVYYVIVYIVADRRACVIGCVCYGVVSGVHGTCLVCRVTETNSIHYLCRRILYVLTPQVQTSESLLMYLVS